MNARSRPGARGGRRALPRSSRAHLLRVAAVCALMACVAWTGPAIAAVLYKCVGPEGETALVSHTTGYRHCEKVGAWATASVHPVEAAYAAPSRQKSGERSGTELPGKPPKPVKANPSVLKVMPLSEGDSIKVQPLTRSTVWQPLPVVAMESLAGRLLPRLLGLESPAQEPASAPEPQPQPEPAPAATTTPAIPLKLEADAPRPPRRGAVYRVRQKNGGVLYTNIASLAQGHEATRLFTYIVECYACNVHSKVDWNTVPLHLAAYGGDIRAAAKSTGVNVALLRAVIHAESGFNPRALSYKGAQGLMQLMPGTALDLGVGDAFDPAQNISGGARYLAALLHDYHGDVQLAAAAYNAGAGAVMKYGGVPPYAETQVYVKRVALLYQRYSKALAGDGPAMAAAGG